jgi:hypothetical protein
MNEDEIRAAAHKRNDEGRHKQFPSRDKYYRAKHNSRMFGDEFFRDKVASYIDSIPLNPARLKHCPACEGVLCDLCGKCHELDRQDWRVDLACPVAHHMHDEDACVTWAYAYLFLKDTDRAARSKA